MHLSKNQADLYKLHFLNHTLKDLENYGARHLLWFRRINAVKMDVLPRFLYLFQTIPIIIPNSFFRQLTGAINKFIWGSLHPRIKFFSMLCNLKLVDGAGLPDFKKYHPAALLMRIVDWLRSTAKQWVRLVNSSSLDFAFLDWGATGDAPIPSTSFSYTANTFSMEQTLYFGPSFP